MLHDVVSSDFTRFWTYSLDWKINNGFFLVCNINWINGVGSKKDTCTPDSESKHQII